MENNKQSSVDWLFDRFFMLFLFQDGIPEELQEAYDQAKEMHKQEIIDAVDGYPLENRNMSGVDYYEKTYGDNNEQQ